MTSPSLASEGSQLFTLKGFRSKAFVLQGTVRFHRRAHLPIVLASSLIDQPIPVPWWNGLPLRLIE
jgi:hypothetical protein